jgi:hypothetical protein
MRRNFAAFLCLLAGLLSMATAAFAGGKGRIDGTVQFVTADDFKGKRSHEKIFVVDGKGKHTELTNLDAKTKKSLRAGSKIRVEGTLAAGTISAETVSVTEAASLFPSNIASGDRKVLVIPVNFADSALTCTVPQLQAQFFGTTGSIDGLYREMSFGGTGMVGKVMSPVTISATSTDSCNGNSFDWAALADQAAAAAGESLTGYNHFMYIIPRNANCPYAGIAYKPGNKAINQGYCTEADVSGHELGHNLGFGHAGGASDTYGDYSDLMGISGLSLRSVNGPHKMEAGWVAATDVANGGGTYRIAPLELTATAAAGAPQVLKLPRPAGGYYYLSYRQPTGFDTSILTRYPQYAAGASVDLWSGPGGATAKLGVLVDGASFTDATSGMVVRQISHDSNGAQIEVVMTPAPEPSPSPSPEPSPSPSPEPSPSPSPMPSPEPTVTPSPDPSPSPMPSPSPSPKPPRTKSNKGKGHR